jgi:alkylation response protein AidB-like acyl-CoA dehydrogenase
MKPAVCKLPQYENAERLEEYLGDPLDAGRVLSFKRAVEWDEGEVYPQAACDEIERWGFHLQYIPVELGGAFRSFEELFTLLRLLARRDVTSAMAHAMSYVASTAIWLKGNEEQKRRLADIIKSGNRVAIMLTEKDHGADVLANEVKAVKVAGGYQLSGEKWLISNATRCAAFTLFARTEAAGGPRGFSLFFVEKQQLDPASYRLLPRIKTLGVRGADISGIAFQDCFIPDSALVGSQGGALETTLKAFQISRTILPAAILGAGDTALRTTLRFALSRRLYNGTVFTIPEARRALVDAFIQLLVCECVAVGAARGLQAASGQMSVGSAVSKYYVPTQMEEAVKGLAVVMGARHFLREEHDFGIFQKILRDNALASLFDGSTVINLNGIAQQLPQIWQAPRKPQNADEVIAGLKKQFCLREPLPDFDPAKLELTNRGRDDITQSLPFVPAAQLQGLARIDHQTLSDLTKLVEEIIQEFHLQKRAVTNVVNRSGNAFNQSTQLFDLARRHCTLHAASAALWMWLCNRDYLDDFFAGGEWLVLGLNRLLMDLQPWRWEFFSSYYERVGQRLLSLHNENRLFSSLPIQLARSQEP